MTKRAVSKLTSKYQTTVPAAVREALLLDKGDSLVFEIGEDGLVTVRKAVPLDDGVQPARSAPRSPSGSRTRTTRPTVSL